MKSEKPQEFINEKGATKYQPLIVETAHGLFESRYPNHWKKQLPIHWIPHKTHVFSWSLCDSERLFVHASLGSEATIFWLLPHAFHSGFTCKLGQYQINDEQKLNDFQDSRRQNLIFFEVGDRTNISELTVCWCLVSSQLLPSRCSLDSGPAKNTHRKSRLSSKFWLELL